MERQEQMHCLKGDYGREGVLGEVRTQDNVLIISNQGVNSALLAAKIEQHIIPDPSRLFPN